jgi:Domain of unknown function (DUF1707)
MATEPNVRVSDTERESVAAQLREHYAQGRLDHDELDERLDRVFASKTRADLGAVTSDLPYSSPSGVLPSDGVRHGSQGAGNGAGWSGPRWNGPGQGSYYTGGPYRRGRSRGSLLRIIPVLLAVWVCIALSGGLSFGLGSGPGVMVIILGALAVLRWIFGLGRRRGPVGRRGGCRRRW